MINERIHLHAKVHPSTDQALGFNLESSSMGGDLLPPVL
jgi:hypothetical protein